MTTCVVIEYNWSSMELNHRKESTKEPDKVMGKIKVVSSSLVTI